MPSSCGFMKSPSDTKTILIDMKYVFASIKGKLQNPKLTLNAL
jgi:hypothetical protein